MKPEVPANIADSGRVRLGGVAPSLPPCKPPPQDVRDEGKVRLGGVAPSI
jgi:hypothetical protein